MDIDKAIKLANSKTATVSDVFKMLSDDIQKFSEEREAQYLQELKEQFEEGLITSSVDTADEYADKIYTSVEADIKSFVVKYVERAMDDVLDAKNENKITSKMGATNLLILLTSLREAYDNTN